MANTIKLKRGSGSDPGASDLSVGELAIRTDTAKLFTKNDAGNVAEISSDLTNLNASNLTSGTVPTARLGSSGTASSSTYLRGDNSWATVTSVGGATGVDFNDTVKARWGTGNDLEIFHDGNDYIKSVGAGDLYIDCVTGDLQIRGTGFSVMGKFIDDGGVELYYDGSKKAETVTGGFTVTGTCTATTFSGSGASLTSLPASQLTGTVAAARLDTATTQSAGNNSTKIATTAYADTAIANLIDSSPSALNTLNELASALGDDANFSTTVTNSIATKLPLAGGTLTGNVKLNDSIKTIFGSDDDAYMMHNGSHQYNRCSTGYYHIQAQEIRFNKADGNETLLKAISDGAVELYHDNVKKLETTSYGGHLTGEWRIEGGDLFLDDDSYKLKIGEHSDITMYHDNGHGYLDNITGKFTINGNNGSGSQRKAIVINPAAGTEIYYDNDKKAETVSGGFTVTGTCTATAFSGDGSNLTSISATDSTKMPLAGGTFSGSVVWDNASNAGKDWKWNPSQNQVEFADGVKLVFGDSDDLEIEHTGSNSTITEAGTGKLILKSNNQIELVASNNESMIEGVVDGEVKLFHNGTWKAKTVSGGFTVDGTCTATAFAGDGSALTGIGSAGTGEVYVKLKSDGSASNSGTSTYAGYQAANNNGGDYNVAIGHQAFYSADTGAENNICIGYQAGYAVMGDKNVAVGDQALKTAGDDSECVAVGFSALKNCTESYNVAIGANAADRVTSGEKIVAIGAMALGFDSGTNVTGDKNTAMGYAAMSRITTGFNNTSVGHQAGNLITEGFSNTCLGNEAGDNITTGDNNIVIGHGADASSATVDNEITLGDTSITKFRIPGINFELADNGGTPTNGHVLTMASGGATWQAAGGTTINNNANNRIITGSGTANTLEGESKLTFDGNTLYCEGSLSFTHDSNDQVNFNSTSAWCVARFQVSGTNRGYVSVGSDTVYLGNSTDGSAIKLKGSSFQFTPNDSDWYDILTSNSTIVATSLATTGNSAPINITTTGNTSSPINIKATAAAVNIENETASVGINIKSKGIILLEATNWAYGIGLKTTATSQAIDIESSGATNIKTTNQSGHAINVVANHALNLEGTNAVNIDAGHACNIEASHAMSLTSAHGMSIKGGHNFYLETGSSYNIEVKNHFVPNANNTYDLGTSSLRWRNLYINDLQLSNKGSQNDVDGTWGDWTLQEGEDSIFMINNRTGKKYRMALQEVS